jgi:hypothetical protein
LIHNHPSGDATPSPEDVRLTQDVATAGELLGIELLDHVVVGRGQHVSLRARGLYSPPSVTSAVTPEWNGIRRNSGKRAWVLGERRSALARLHPRQRTRHTRWLLRAARPT